MVILDLEHSENVNGEDIVGGESVPPNDARFLGGSTGTFSIALIGDSSNTTASSNSTSNLSGNIGNFNVTFGTTITIQSSFPAS